MNIYYCFCMEPDFTPDFRKRLKIGFYHQKTEDIAKNLLGKVIVRLLDNDYLAAMIVETEAYLSDIDAASHSFVGRTKRNMPMFEKGGIIYVYKSYGIHFCTNIVTESEGSGSAVLIRAAEPIAGIEKMKQFRNLISIDKLMKGPGNFSNAFGIDLSYNYQSVCSKNLFIQDYLPIGQSEIKVTKRIGISRSVDLPLRYYLINSRFVSKK